MISIAQFADVKLNQYHEVGGGGRSDGVKKRIIEIKETECGKLNFLVQKLKTEVLEEKILLFVVDIVLDFVDNQSCFY